MVVEDMLLPIFATAALQPLLVGRRRAVTPPPSTPAIHLDMAMQQQEQTSWCWSAVSVSVKLFFNATVPIKQCEQANHYLSQTTCCIDGGSNVCNTTGALDGALSVLGNLAAFKDGAISFSNVLDQISSSRPVGCRIGWLTAGHLNNLGHFVVIDGCDPGSPNQLLTIKDPFYGTSIFPYNMFAKAYLGGTGMWTHSYLTQP